MGVDETREWCERGKERVERGEERSEGFTTAVILRLPRKDFKKATTAAEIEPRGTTTA